MTPVEATEIAKQLARLWARAWDPSKRKWTILDEDDTYILSGFTRERGWKQFERVAAALTRRDGRRIPLRVLDALEGLPAWRHSEDSFCGTPRGDEIDGLQSS